jgi:hypothetical protein
MELQSQATALSAADGSHAALPAAVAAAAAASPAAPSGQSSDGCVFQHVPSGQWR